jgi:hypothetical protein
MGPTLLVFGGGAHAAPALRWAREAGLHTILADSDTHAPARRAAQEFHSIPARDAEAHAALARRTAKTSRLAGVLVGEPSRFALLSKVTPAVPGLLPARPALERLSSPERTREFLRGAGFPVCEAAPERQRLDLFAFFRDEAFVPGGIAARRALARGAIASVQPCGLQLERERGAYVLAERAARALGLERGLLQVELAETDGELALVGLQPGFADLVGATHVARLAYGKSPLQAWLAHLAGAGGPFDELALAPRAAAGWLALLPERSGLFAGVDGLSRARAVPGLVDLWVEEPGRECAPGASEPRPLGYLWAEAPDPAQLVERLLAARAALDVRVASPTYS